MLKTIPLYLVSEEDLDIVSTGEYDATKRVFVGASVIINEVEHRGDVVIAPGVITDHKNTVLYITDRRDDIPSGTNTLRLNIDDNLHDVMRSLRSKLESLPCHTTFAAQNPLFLADLYTSLAVERLQAKSERISQWYDLYRGDSEEVCYVSIARSLGFGINSNPFEELACKLPLKYLQKHSNSIFQVEAMLFGVAGLLSNDDNCCDPYYKRMLNEYKFLKNKFSLNEIDPQKWQFARVRPTNTPHQRIAYLASLITGGFSMFAKILEVKTLADVKRIFTLYVSEYWECHSSFGVEMPTYSRGLGAASIELLIINSISPILYTYSKVSNKQQYADRAVELLEGCKGENNSIVRNFTSHDIECRDALTSQALIQLNKEYCTPRRCLLCKVGIKHIFPYVKDGVVAY